MSDIVTGIKLKGDASGLVGETKRARNELDRFRTATDRAGQQAKVTSQEVDRLGVASGGMLRHVKAAGAALLVAYAGTELVRNLADTTRRFEILQSALVTATGSATAAVSVFKSIQQTAAETPFSVEQLTTAFIKLKNLGLDPSKAAIMSYGNTASAMGKSLDQFIEAVADASVAEFERLKEFGIRAKNQGDTVTFTFKGVRTTVANEASAIENYLLRLGNIDFAGGIERRAATLDGAISNLGDSWDNLMFSIAETGVSDIMKTSLRTVSNGLDAITARISSGELMAALSAYAGAWSGWGDLISDSIDLVTNLFAQFPEEVQMASDAISFILSTMGNAFLTFPQNVLAMVKTIAVELSTLEQVGRLYILQFGASVQNGLKELVAVAGAYARDLADKLNPFDGDTYDLSGELAQIKTFYTQQKAESNAFFDSRIQGSWNAREEALNNIRAERDASISSMNAQLAAAKALATARQNPPAANDNDFTNSGGNTPAITPEQQQANYDALKQAYLSEEQLLIQHAQAEMATIAQKMATNQVTQQQGLDLMLAAKRKHEEQVRELEQQRASENGVNANGETMFDQLRARFATQEELLRMNAQNEMQIIAEAAQAKQITQQQSLDLMLAAREKHLSELQALEVQRANMIMSGAQQTFGGLASMAKTFGGEQSKAYKTLFAISKGFAISQGILNLATAISNASAAQPWYMAPVAIAQAAASGASLLANIKGATLQGQAHGGLDKNVREGTWWLRNDEMVLNPRQRRSFENMVAANDNVGGRMGGNNRAFTFSPKVTIHAPNATPGMETKIADSVQAGMAELYERIREDFAGQGELRQTLSNVA
ncbi:tape measure protein [Alteromonas confluentis]|uniref:Tape measure protein N-terminal domain-containing protein n=1 Tax=Alteromonas confluentis TaxID=1656094 RepID=A0A1E7ZE84_9ALTE|nr:tape measure protein [Alteromonas confluentis]OFC71819.1 hypothetical protein BFC18_06600 [Alteromonas confluentis]